MAPRDLGPFLQAFIDQPDLDERLGYEEPPTPRSFRRRLREEARERESGGSITLAIGARADAAYLGQITLHSFNWHHKRADVGFFVVPDARRGGVALEALRLIVGWAFAALALVRVGLATEVGNQPTIRLAERAGFAREGVLRAFSLERGRPVDNLYFSALPGDPAWA